jgi:rod shape-determining protein MreD
MTARVWIRLLLLVVCAAIFQVAVLDNLVIHYAHADVMLLLAIGAGLAGGPQDGAVAAFITGLVADLFVDTPYGVSALTFVLVAFAVGLATLASGPGERAGAGFRFAAALLGGAGGTLLYAGISYILGQPLALAGNLVTTVLVVTLGNAIMAVPVFASVRWAFSPPADHAAAIAASRAR